MGKMKKFLWLVVIICAIFAFNNVYERAKIEQTSGNISLTVDSKTIFKNQDDLSAEEILIRLRNAGVTNVGFSENTLKELGSRGIISVYDGSELKNSLYVSNLSFEPAKNKTYVFVNDENYKEEVKEIIISSELGKTNILEGNGDERRDLVIEIEKKMDKVISVPMLPLHTDVQLLAKYMDFTLRVSDGWKARENVLEDYISYLADNIVIKNVVFAGESAPLLNGGLNPYWFGYQIGLIEVFDAKQKQKNVEKYVYKNDFNAFRVHSFSYSSINESSADDFARMVAKASNERNIRMFYINLPVVLEVDGEFPVFERIDLLTNVVAENGYEVSSEIIPFEKPLVSGVNLMLAALAIVALTLLFIKLVVLDLFNKKVPAWVVISLSLIGMIAVLMSTKSALMNSIFSLWITILVPIYLVVLVYKNKENLRNKYFIAESICVYLVGLILLIALNSELDKVLYLQGFRGVSLTLLLPIAVAAIYLMIKNAKRLELRVLLKRNIKIGEILVMGVIFLVGMYYLSRSGNGGMMIPFEAELRNALEDLLSVRPRTKEFLIAMPIVVLMLYYFNKFKIAIYALPVFAMYIASTFNTFTHFHTPLEISVIRTFYGAVIGIVVGVMGVIIIETIRNLLKKMSKKTKN